MVEKFLNIKVEYLGGILNDANCQKAVMQQDPVMLSFPNSNTASAIQKIAAMRFIRCADDSRDDWR